MSSNIQELNTQNFVSTLKPLTEPVLIDFWAPWCPPCRQLAPVLDRLAERFDGRLKVFKVNVDQNEALSSQFKIGSIPALLLLHRGELIAHWVGFRSEEQLAEQIETSLLSGLLR